MRVFISYCHKQEEWVLTRLVPCLKAGGAVVFIDRERFRAGGALNPQMDEWQDKAHRQILIPTEEYFNSSFCRRELDRAIEKDPLFEKSVILPIRRDGCAWPDSITTPNPLYVDLRDDRDPAPWNLLFQECNADLGVDPPAWLQARDDMVRFLKRNESVNLVVNGTVKPFFLIDEIKKCENLTDLGVVDLENPAAVSRTGLLKETLRSLGHRTNLSPKPNDLVEFGDLIASRKSSFVAYTHFDLAAYRDEEYGVDLFSSLRYLIMTSKKLTALFVSHAPFAALLPRDHPLSHIDVKTVQLGCSR